MKLKIFPFVRLDRCEFCGTSDLGDVAMLNDKIACLDCASNPESESFSFCFFSFLVCSACFPPISMLAVAKSPLASPNPAPLSPLPEFRVGPIDTSSPPSSPAANPRHLTNQTYQSPLAASKAAPLPPAPSSPVSSHHSDHGNNINSIPDHPAMTVSDSPNKLPAAPKFQMPEKSSKPPVPTTIQAPASPVAPATSLSPTLPSPVKRSGAAPTTPVAAVDDPNRDTTPRRGVRVTELDDDDEEVY
jgi:hypothetical protein